MEKLPNSEKPKITKDEVNQLVYTEDFQQMPNGGAKISMELARLESILKNYTPDKETKQYVQRRIQNIKTNLKNHNW